MRILITGGCGYIGVELAKAYSARKITVFVLDNLSTPFAKKNSELLKKLPKVKFEESDVTNYTKIKKIFKKVKPHAVFHLAGMHNVQFSLENPIDDAKVNILSSLNILEATRHHTPKAIIVYPSTHRIYGNLEYLEFLDDKTRFMPAYFPNGFNENIQTDFQTPNTCSIGAVEQYMLDYYRLYKIKTIVLRQSVVVGKKQNLDSDDFVESIVKFAINQREKNANESITLLGKGKEVIDILYIDDLIESYMNSVDFIDKTEGQIFNIGGGVENTLSGIELIKYLESTLNFKLNYKLEKVNTKQKSYFTNYQKARSLMHWGPKLKKEQILQELTNYYMN
jgi:CDP-paratose 2-epimerase